MPPAPAPTPTTASIGTHTPAPAGAAEAPFFDGGDWVALASLVVAFGAAWFAWRAAKANEQMVVEQTQRLGSSSGPAVAWTRSRPVPLCQDHLRQLPQQLFPLEGVIGDPGVCVNRGTARSGRVPGRAAVAVGSAG